MVNLRIHPLSTPLFPILSYALRGEPLHDSIHHSTCAGGNSNVAAD